MKGSENIHKCKIYQKNAKFKKCCIVMKNLQNRKKFIDKWAVDLLV